MQTITGAVDMYADAAPVILRCSRVNAYRATRNRVYP